MAKISYGFENVEPEFIASYSAENHNSDEKDPSIVALSGGGFALAYEWRSLDFDINTGTFPTAILLERYAVEGTLYQPVGVPLGFIQIDAVDGGTTVDPAITQLTDGRILTTWTQSSGSGAGIRYAIVDAATGDVTTPDTLLPGTNGLDFASDVAALPGGGFAVVKQEDRAATDQDADLLIYDSDGASVAAHSLGGNSFADEQNPVLAVLANGNIAVAYEKELVDDTDAFGISVEIYTPAGVSVLAPILIDPNGVSPAIVALQDGGFAVANAHDAPNGDHQ
ncbi:MAG TPA: hypothetical protein VFX03_08470, partial [Thermomicrobiales bacterium]|nr:hypothetical protein [Thermomicrobiales bacterium]